jgi:hypothetical protein
MVENSIIGSGYGRMRDQIMVEKHRQVVDSTLGQDQVMAELTLLLVSSPQSVKVSPDRQRKKIE